MSVATGVGLDGQTFPAEDWKTYAAPSALLTTADGAPISAVVPSPERATALPNWPPTVPLLRVAVGLAVLTHLVTDATWKT